MRSASFVGMILWVVGAPYVAANCGPWDGAPACYRSKDGLVFGMYSFGEGYPVCYRGQSLICGQGGVWVAGRRDCAGKADTPNPVSKDHRPAGCDRSNDASDDDLPDQGNGGQPSPLRSTTPSGDGFSGGGSTGNGSRRPPPGSGNLLDNIGDLGKSVTGGLVGGAGSGGSIEGGGSGGGDCARMSVGIQQAKAYIAQCRAVSAGGMTSVGDQCVARMSPLLNDMIRQYDQTCR